jgi:hypothetical protein
MIEPRLAYVPLEGAVAARALRELLVVFAVLSGVHCGHGRADDPCLVAHAGGDDWRPYAG